MLPPMALFKGERYNYEWGKGEVPGTVHGMSPNGWIDQDLFTRVNYQFSSTTIFGQLPCTVLEPKIQSYYTMK